MRQPRVIYEDKDFLALAKPDGLLVHSSTHARGPTVVDWLIEHYPEVRGVGDNPEARPGIVHRLDRETSGVMLIARNQKYFDYLKSLFKEHAVVKTYLAVVLGEMVERRGTVDVPISLKPGSVRHTVHMGKMTKTAITKYRVLRSWKNAQEESFTLLEVQPQTGRTHQIRLHLASLEHPVLGDRLYGKRAAHFASRLMLHALSVEFNDSQGKRIRLEVGMPPDFENALRALE